MQIQPVAAAPSVTNFHGLLNSLNAGLAQTDASGKFVAVNHRFCQITGYTQEELMQRTMMDITHPNDVPANFNLFAACINEGKDFAIEKRYIHKSGLPVWVNNQVSLVMMADGTALISAVCIDITDIKATEQRLAELHRQENRTHHQLMESEARFRSLVEEAPVATCLFAGSDMVVEIANEAMLRLWGKDASVIGKPLREAVPELQGQPFLDILDEVFITGKAYEAKEAVAQLEVDGKLRTFYFDFTYKPLFNTLGQVYGIMDMAVDVTDKVAAQRKAEEEQRQILSSFEESPAAIAIIDKEELTFRAANPFYAELVGRQPHQIVNKPLLEALPELQGQGFDNLLKQVISSGVAYSANEVTVNVVRRGQLETIYVNLTYQPRRNGQDEVTGVLVVATDVTAQVVSRQQLQASETKLRGIIAAAPAAIGLFVGRDLIVENPNQTFIDIVGKGPAIEGKPLREVMPELVTEGQPFLKILDDVFTTGVQFQSPGSQVKIVRNGVMTDNYYNITYTPVFDADGKVYAILDIAIDVTEQIKAQQALAQAETNLRAAVELGELAEWSLDVKNSTFHYSPRFMNWLGFSESTKDMDSAYNPLPHEFRQSVADAVSEAIQPGASGMYENEHPVINRTTGERRIIQARARVSYDATGQALTLSGTARDVTRERQQQQALEFQVRQRTEELRTTNRELDAANKALQQNNEELEQFAYIASHDLQEPLRKVSTFSEMLKTHLGEVDGRAGVYFEKIGSSIQRMQHLIRDVLSFSRLSNKNEAVEPVALKELVENILTDFDLLLEQNGGRIEVGELPVVEANALQMRQLFGNLISNALKFTKAGVPPLLTITGGPASDAELEADLLPGVAYYHLTVTDNGIGFEQEHAEKIFSIFQRLHGRSEYQGTGIGLAMCKKIVLNHAGKIWATSVKGEGASFHVLLPERMMGEFK